MIVNTIFSCLQIAALIYLAAASIRINRLQTLAKNLDWVIQNPQFIKNNSEPVYWPLIAMGIVLFGIIIASSLMDSIADSMKIKYLGILIATSVLYGAYYLIYTKLSEKIPLRKERTASLSRRTLQSYVRPSLILTAKAGAMFVVLAIIISFVMHKISLALLIYDISVMGVGYCLIWVGILLGLKEKIPHENDISQVTIINVGENYRMFSMNLLIGMLFFFSLFTLFHLGLQWFGLDITRDITKETLYRLLGEPIPVFRPVFTLQQWDIISSVLSSILFIIMVKSKPFRDILSIKIKPVQLN
jgi:hypothetical protein